MTIAEQLLTSFLDVTRRLAELTSAGEGEMDTEQLEQLLAERDRLMVEFDQLPQQERTEASLQGLLEEIKKVDLLFQVSLESHHRSTQAKINEMQAQKRVTNAYSETFEYGAAFIDRKK